MGYPPTMPYMTGYQHYPRAYMPMGFPYGQYPPIPTVATTSTTDNTDQVEPVNGQASQIPDPKQIK